MKLPMRPQLETDPAIRGQHKPRQEAPFGGLLPGLALVFLLSISVRMYFAFADTHSPLVYSCDASEYLRDARGLLQLLQAEDSKQLFVEALDSLGKTLPAQDAERLHNSFAPVKELAIAGPIFPLFILLSYTSFGLSIDPTGWFAPVAWQCLLTSITCALIAFVGTRAWSKEVGLTAGVAAALYPGFIVNSLRMYSESFSCFWLCLVVALTIPVLEKRGMFHSVSAGFGLAVLQLTRSIMVLFSAIEFALTLWLSTGKSRIARCAGLLVGMTIVFAPWLLFQQMAFGKCSLVIDRVGHYNLFTGTNVASQGWLAFPYPDGKGIEKKSYIELVGKQVKDSPTRFARLMLDKPLRLFKFPWNDFRTPIGAIGCNLQVIFHQAILCFAAIGLALCTFNKAEKGQLRIRGLILLLGALHLVYLMFITVPRYNLTAMPFFILLAAAALAAVFNSIITRLRAPDPTTGLTLHSSQGLLGAVTLAMLCCRIDWIGALFLPFGLDSKLALILAASLKAISVSLMFMLLIQATSKMQKGAGLSKLIALTTALIVVPLSALPIRAHGRWYEWRAAGNLEVKQQIVIPREKLASAAKRDCYLLVDCQDWKLIGNGGKVVINGVECKSPQLPLMPFAQNLSEMKSRSAKGRVQQYLECEDIYNSLNIAAGGSNLDLRQWFIVPINRAIMDSAISANQGNLNIQINSGRDTDSGIYGAYQDEDPGHCRIPSVARYSWEKAFYGVEEENGFSDSRYDDKIAIQTGRSRSSLSLNRSNPNIRLLIAPETGQNGSSQAGSLVASAKKPGSKVELSGSSLPKYGKENTWLVSVESVVASTNSMNIPVVTTLAIESIDERGQIHRYRSPWTPSTIVSPVGSSQIRFAVPVKPSAIPGRISNLSFEYRAGGVAAGREYFSVNGPNAGKRQPGSFDRDVAVKETVLSISELPSNPIGLGYEIF